MRFAIKAIEACRNPKLRLLVVGRGDEEKFERSFVRFLGEMADLRRVYAAADIFILPTIYDPFSVRVVQEEKHRWPDVELCCLEMQRMRRAGI